MRANRDRSDVRVFDYGRKRALRRAARRRLLGSRHDQSRSARPGHLCRRSGRIRVVDPATCRALSGYTSSSGARSSLTANRLQPCSRTTSTSTTLPGLRQPVPSTNAAHFTSKLDSTTTPCLSPAAIPSTEASLFQLPGSLESIWTVPPGSAGRSPSRSLT